MKDLSYTIRANETRGFARRSGSEWTIALQGAVNVRMYFNGTLSEMKRAVKREFAPSSKIKFTKN
jgi:hypothetical protein